MLHICDTRHLLTIFGKHVRNLWPRVQHTKTASDELVLCKINHWKEAPVHSCNFPVLPKYNQLSFS